MQGLHSAAPPPLVKGLHSAARITELEECALQARAEAAAKGAEADRCALGRGGGMDRRAWPPGAGGGCIQFVCGVLFEINNEPLFRSFIRVLATGGCDMSGPILDTIQTISLPSCLLPCLAARLSGPSSNSQTRVHRQS